MKNVKIFFFRSNCLLIFSLFILSSCSTQKRLYTKGFYSHRNQTTKKTQSIAKNDSLPVITANNPIKKNKAAILITTNSKTKSSFLLNPNTKLVTGCDTIILRGGARITANISEINPTKVIFKNCGSLDEQSLSLQKNDIKTIIYANGTKENFTPEDDKYIPQNISTDKNYQQQRPGYGHHGRRDRNTGADKHQNGFATAGFFTALVSHTAAIIVLFYTFLNSIGGGSTFMFSWFYAPLALAVLAFLFSAVAIYQITQNKETQKGLTLAIVGLALSLILIGILIAIYISVI